MKIYYKIFLWKFKRIPTQVAQVHIQFSGKRFKIQQIPNGSGYSK